MVYTLEYIRSLTAKYKDVHLEGIDHYLERYSRILQEDKVVPIFSKTTKYKSFPKKHFKKGIKKDNAIIFRGHHSLFVPKTDIQKIHQIVRNTLNKINESNSKKIINNLKRSLCEFNSVETLDILAYEIYEKMLFDYNHLDIYIDLCSKIWEMKDWHDQLVTVVENERKLYWCENFASDKEDTTLHGPYRTEEELRIITRRKVNFKRTLVNMMQKMFNEREQLLEQYASADDDVRYKAKRSLFTIVEFINSMDKHLSEKVINLILMQLINITDAETISTQPHDLFVEAFCNYWRSKGVSNNYKEDYKVCVHQLLTKFKWQSRTFFMLEDVYQILGGKELNFASNVDPEEEIDNYLKNGVITTGLIKHLKDEDDILGLLLTATLDNYDNRHHVTDLIRVLNISHDSVNEYFDLLDVDDIIMDYPFVDMGELRTCFLC